MIVKLATLFLIVMAVLGMIFGRRRKRGRGKDVTGAPGRTAKAARCPDCGSWIVEGARCPCKDGKG